MRDRITISASALLIIKSLKNDDDDNYVGRQQQLVEESCGTAVTGYMSTTMSAMLLQCLRYCFCVHQLSLDKNRRSSSAYK